MDRISPRRQGDRSWSGLVKRFTSNRCDLLFVLVGDGRRWSIPSEAVDGGARVVLDGPKYAEFEVEPGQPLPSHARPDRYARQPRRGTQAVNGDAL
jgi:hypothetical protein